MSEPEKTTVAITGGGPAGVMLGLLLARAGINVVVFEKHGDFFRDFRGDTVHPSTMELLDELGMIEEFKQIPQGKFQRLALREDLQLGSIAELPLKYPFIAIAPQWDFLNLLAKHAKQYPSFQLRMQCEVIDILRENGATVGVRFRDEDGQEKQIRSILTVAADGRSSTVRQAANLATHNFGAPFDVLWFRLSKSDPNKEEFYFKVVPYRWVVCFDRHTYVQVAYIIRKGLRDEIHAQGIEKFRQGMAETVPELADRVAELRSFEDIKFLEVQVNRAPRWHLPGLLLIGDAAHAMSPMGGVGVNYAIQDAVAAANLLYSTLIRCQQQGVHLPESKLKAVQSRREFPTALIQLLQRVAQNRLVEPALHGRVSQVPAFARFMQRFGPLRRLFLRILTVGIRQEHIHVPEKYGSVAPDLDGTQQ
jgi:2-polyprenyl-6-methoxyphenol hydroxylase-like FAD-dependent oxidoreductase